MGETTSCRSATRSGWQVAEVTGPFDKAEHFGGCIERQAMGRKAGPRRDIGGHVANQFELPIGRLRQQRDEHVFERDHANLELHKLGICQRRNVGLPIVRK